MEEVMEIVTLLWIAGSVALFSAWSLTKASANREAAELAAFEAQYGNANPFRK